MTRNGYPSDVRGDAWAFIAPGMTLMTDDAPQRHLTLRAVLNGPVRSHVSSVEEPGSDPHPCTSLWHGGWNDIGVMVSKHTDILGDSAPWQPPFFED